MRVGSCDGISALIRRRCQSSLSLHIHTENGSHEFTWDGSPHQNQTCRHLNLELHGLKDSEKKMSALSNPGNVILLQQLKLMKTAGKAQTAVFVGLAL